MKDLMETIITIDKAANNKLNDAIRRKEEAMEEVKRRTEILTREIEEKAKKHLAQLETTEMQSIEAELQQIHQKTLAEKQRLSAIYEEKHPQWITSIVDSVLN